MSTPPVVLINAFEVLEAEDEAFLASWEQARAHLAAQDGYLSTRLQAVPAGDTIGSAPGIRRLRKDLGRGRRVDLNQGPCPTTSAREH